MASSVLQQEWIDSGCCTACSLGRPQNRHLLGPRIDTALSPVVQAHETGELIKELGWLGLSHVADTYVTSLDCHPRLAK
jgi:hypothetical protein